MSPFGNACKNLTNFFNTSLSNTISGSYQEFTIRYINGSEIEAVWESDTITMNNQIFVKMLFGLPTNIKGNDSISIPDTTGLIGLMPYQNNQIVGLALSSNSEDVGNGGSVTFGGIDSGYIIGNNESNIVYQPLPQLSPTNEQFMFNVTNIYMNDVPINISGLFWLNSEIQTIQLDDDSAGIVVNRIPGGNYSSGGAIIDCNFTLSFDISFEIANQKWRLPLNTMIKDVINGTSQCESIITGGANSGFWIFGSAFIKSFYMVFDQSQSRFGIASRSDIDYGPLPASRIAVHLPWFLAIQYQYNATCLKITDQLERSQVFSIDNIDPNGFFHLSDIYFAQEGFTYSIDFYYDLLNNTDICTTGLHFVYTPSLKADVTTGLWEIGLNYYSTTMRLQVLNGVVCFVLLVVYGQTVFYEMIHILFPSDAVIDGYIDLPLPLIYLSGKYTLVAFDNVDYDSETCIGNVITSKSSLYPNITANPWTINFN
ncbi:8642_t:CDS:2 [Gigaspora rosea]|nr:8642_t:CDS:2 [Gigaspora rosea]